MIKYAWNYEEFLKDKLMDTWYDEKYKFYNYSKFHEAYHNPDADLADHYDKRFVSLFNGKIIGFMGYELNNYPDYVYGFYIILFSDTIGAKREFVKDVMQVVDDIFCKFRYDKIKFSVIVGNPAERMYDKFINDFGGRIVGTFKNDVQLIDNRMYDRKFYEIHRSDYLYASDYIKKKYHVNKGGDKK